VSKTKGIFLFLLLFLLSSAFDMIVNKTKQNYRSRGLNLNIKRNFDKARFKIISTHPLVNRG
jgi:hypothetical protein